MQPAFPLISSRKRSAFHRFWWWALAFLSFALLAPAYAFVSSAETAELIVQRAFWEDPTGQADLAGAQAQTYTPYRGLFRRGYSASAHWIRLTLAPTPTRTALIVKPTWLDSVTLFDPLGSSSPITLGDRHANAANAWPGLGYAFVLPATAQQREVWLRVQTTSSHLLMIDAVPLEQSLKDSAQHILLSGLYASIQVLVLVLLCFIWWSQRDRLIGLYLVRHGVYAAYGAAYLGLPALVFSDLLPPAFMHHLFVLLSIAVVSVSIRFDIDFLSLYRPRQLWISLMQVIMWSGVVLLLMALSGFTRDALQLNIWLVMASMPVVLLALLSTRPDQSGTLFPSRRVMAAYYSVVIASLPLGLLSLLGKVEFQLWSLYGLIFHGLITGLIMSAILLLRAQRLAKHHQRMSWELRKTRQDMLLEQQRREEQSQFWRMLMHEIRTPLSIVSVAIGTQNNREGNLAHARGAVRDMKAIIERCVQADQLDQLTLLQHRASVNLSALVMESAQDIPQLESRVQCNVETDLPDLQTDPHLLKIVLCNLLGNAQRYSDEHTPIMVQVEAADRKLESSLQHGLSVRVANTPGLAGWPDEQQVFQKYYRASGAQRQSGAGLGLYLAQRLILSLGGTLEYAPSARYVEFVLWIPLTPA